MKKINFWIEVCKEENEYYASIQDFGKCVVTGRTIEELIEKSKEYLNRQLFKNGDKFMRNNYENISFMNDKLYILVTIYPELYNYKIRHEMVKVSIELPKWLVGMIKSEKIDCAKMIEEFLSSYFSDKY
ncbi:type II toxin-antitoxin system HicB family antitoxin [Anaerorhabdus furcosa]|uniref:HicB family protein n=1 Tax=Anaerorhabdus furcosa TaxID=118967 RepID=A0A1T4MJ69_9FIRM|nr:hypothetical protein [Anaerorhabdus furcosa]SJZ66886.1 hypothetical protein SAMN02745191_1268 [Anaerorhabdus furcosa]